MSIKLPKVSIFCIMVLFCSFQAVAKQRILIYSGPGAGPKSVANTLSVIHQLVGENYLIETATAETIIDDAWLENTALLIMPGGADRPYLEKLSGKGNANIRQYVENGGKFLGICAGAYYSADRIEFARGDKELEVVGDRELKFFPGLVSGPTYSGYDHRDTRIDNGVRAAKIYWQQEGPFKREQMFTIFYNGGGSFVAAEQYANVTVLAHYDARELRTAQRPVAIVECIVGKGKVILSGPHFEWDPASFDKDSKQLMKIKPLLTAENSNRLLLAKHLLDRLGLSAK